MHRRRKTIVTDRRSRSAISNGTRILPAGVADGRSSAYRRYRDLLSAHFSDLGGEPALSEGQKALVRRAVTLTIQCESMEAKFVEDGDAATTCLETYQRMTNSLRRTLESLGINRGRKPRDVTPPDLS